MRPLFLLILGAISAIAQPVTFGVKGGVPVNDFFSTVESPNFGFNSHTQRYIVGPTFEVRLPFGLGIEFDALYRHLNYSATNGTGSALVTQAVSGNSWEFPLMAKYRFPTKVVRPFVDAGITWNTLTGVKQSIESATGISNTPPTTQSVKGFVMGAGIDIHALVIHLSPEIRYTHWGSSSFVDPVSLVRVSQNQGEFLLGITF
jgi:hypothetical protein